MTRATVLSKANVEVDSPFICTMGILMNGVQRHAAIIGNQARALWEDLNPQAVIELVGHDAPDKCFLGKENMFLVDNFVIVEE